MKYEKSMKFNIASYSPPADASSVSAGPLMAGRSFPKKNSRAYTDIALACLIICIPMLTLSAGLLGIIYAYRVIQRDSDLLFSESSDGVDIDPSAYLVNYSATRLITIASWTSSVAPLLPGFVMTLLSFPAARRFLRTSQAGQEHSLPTPYQLGLYLQILTGGVSSLWQWIKYRSWSKREKQTSVVTLLVLHLSSATIVGYAILAADTWLHVTTSTVIYQQVNDLPLTELQNYGRCLYSTDCSTRSGILNTPCTVDSSASTRLLMGANEAYATINSVSSMNSISSFTNNGIEYAVLLPASIPQSVDYRAATFAISTQCMPVSHSCNLNALSGASTPFNCSTGFHGDATLLKQFTSSRRASSPVGYVLLSEWEGKSNITIGSMDMNPFFVGTWAMVDTQGHLVGAPDPSLQLTKDPEIVKPNHGGLAWVLKCNTSVYDLVYTYRNGTITETLLSLANASTGGLVAAPMNEDFPLSNLEIATKVASFSSNAQQLADKWAKSYSQTALGLSAGVMTSKPSSLEHQRTPILVARIPKAPLFTLVALNLIYVIIGLGLALYAMLTSDFAGGVAAIRQRLTIPGLIAECFEDSRRAPQGWNEVERLFAENDGKGLSGRVAAEEGENGGWRLRNC